MLEPVLLARKHNFGTSLNCCDIPSISKKQYQVIIARYHTPQVLINLCRVSGVRDEKKWSDGVKLQPIETKSQEKRKEAI